MIREPSCPKRTIRSLFSTVYGVNYLYIDLKYNQNEAFCEFRLDTKKTCPWSFKTLVNKKKNVLMLTRPASKSHLSKSEEQKI